MTNSKPPTRKSRPPMKSCNPANEELETSKEELQSLNEELNTINFRLQEKVDELEGVNNDVVNLLSSTDIATFFWTRSCGSSASRRPARIFSA